MIRLVAALVVAIWTLPTLSWGAVPILGSWQFKNEQMEVNVEFLPDGSFKQVTVSARGRQALAGQYQMKGQVLSLATQGYPPQQLKCRFQGADAVFVTYPTGETLQWNRAQSRAAEKGEQKAALPAPSKSVPADTPKQQVAPVSPAQPVSAGKRPTVLLQRIWESNEKAFTYLVPKRWKTQGGIFNVNPRKMNGPGNTIAPKLDLTVKSDERATLAFRWVPAWNYADLSLSRMAPGMFKPGQNYQGMPVKPLLTARQFLLDLFRSSRPQASGVKVVAEDPMPEVVEAYNKNSQQINQNLRQRGLAPIHYEAVGMVVGYTEGGVPFREGLVTTIIDNRAGAFMWSNEGTIVFRAPVAEFDAWKPVLDLIRSSREMNPQWVAAVNKAVGQRSKNALETQRYINKVANEIVENRRRTNAEIRHENWLFISGQEEYKNPFTGKTELGTSQYHYRWVNNQGDILYTDENSFDPNKYEEYNTREWKTSPVRPR
jgi:hypothetical protein